jgi:hypothetical protein
MAFRSRGWPRPSSLEWFLLLLGTLLTLQQAWLLDDAFIYFRYADNLLYLDRGLTYNDGEFVEGYSSPLWMLICIAARASGLDWWWIVRLTGVLSWTLCAFGVMAIQRRLHPTASAGANLPLAFLAVSYPTLCYWTSGLEAPLVQLSAPLLVLHLLNPSSRLLQACLALLPLIRHELALSWIVCAVWSFLRTRRVPWALIAMTSVVMTAWLIFRVFYYAELIPNTFYLKDGENLTQGLRYVAQTVRAYHLLEFAAIVAAAAAIAHRRKITTPHRATRLIMLLCALIQTAYVVRVGGDMMHHRFLAFSFVLAVLAAAGIIDGLWSRMDTNKRRALDLAAATVCLALSASFYPPHLQTNPLLGPPDVVPGPPALIDGTNDAMSHRMHRDLRFSPWVLASKLDQRERYSEYRLSGAGSRHERVVSEGWCYDAFVAFDARVVHRWGLTDPILARLDLPWSRPGHRKGLDAFARQLMYHQQFAARGERELRFRAADTKRQRLPDWIRKNLDAVDLLQRKMYNSHRWKENIALAVRFVGRYSP